MVKLPERKKLMPSAKLTSRAIFMYDCSQIPVRSLFLFLTACVVYVVKECVKIFNILKVKFHCVFSFFSSPEPKAHGCANSIPMTLAFACQLTFSNIFSIFQLFQKISFKIFKWLL